MRNILSFLFLLSTIVAFGQPGTAPEKTIDGKKYYVHKVQQGNTLWGLQQMYGVKLEKIMEANPSLSDGLKTGSEVLIPMEESVQEPIQKTTSKYKVKKSETLYGISRKFETTVDELIALNPELQNEGLKKGQWILVPGEYQETEVEDVTEVDPLPNPFVVDTVETETHTEQVAVSFSDTTIRHKVLPHETMYSISKRFMVKIDTIMKLNNLKNTSLSEGQILIIPVKQERIDRVKIKPIKPDYNPDGTDPLEFPIKDRYGVAVLIPLHLEYGPGYSEYVSKLATQYYMGSKLALDSLKAKGLNADVYFYDTKNDSATVIGILNKPEFADIDLIIGPFFPNNHKIVADYCKQNKVRMVCPLASNSSLLEGNRLVYASVPSNITLMRGLARYMLLNNKKDNIVLIKPTKDSDKPLYDAFRDAFSELPVDGPRPALSESTIDGLKNYIRRGVNTIFVVPTIDNYTAGKFMNYLNKSAFRSKADDLFVYGMKEWVNFTDINGTYKNKYNFHFPSPNFLDYYTEEVTELNKNFRSQYKTDLPKMAIQAYDVMMHFCGEFFLQEDLFQMMNDIEMVQISDNDGFENQKVYIVEQEEYELINAELKDE